MGVCVHAWLWPVHPSKADRGKAACLESFKQSENTFLHVESFLPIGVSLFPKAASLRP